MATITINTDLCDGCASCVEKCPMEVLIVEAGKAKPARPDLCMCCQLCEVDCENQAISVHE
ncbi:MAG: 4Fe-4S binding protein [Thermodesulfobacteriota bacterium]